jgi:hypothetical protein
MRIETIRIIERQQSRLAVIVNKQVTPGSKITFFARFVITGLVGLQHLLVPRLATVLAGIEITETVPWRLMGAALLGFAASSWMASRESVWARVRILVIMEIIWSALGALVILWGIAFEGLPPSEWLSVATLGGLAAAFAVFFSKMERA